MDRVIEHLLALPAWAAVTMVFLLPALEASSWPGVVLPGQSAVMAGGVLAYHGKAPIAVVLAAAVLGAVAGPGIGYAVGRRWGGAMLARLPKRLVKPADLDRAQDRLRHLGAAAVVGARFIGVLRTLVPVMSGAAHMPYRRFLVWNAVGGSVWAVAWVLMGFAAGSGAQRGGAAEATGLLVAAAAVVVVLRAAMRRIRAGRSAGSGLEAHS
ncbi:DedA family protein [Wenjunlia tyrosinilytica]|uniref:Membrane protein n=1 Tax=Wenjunlia tyrosinilytica TaxID=1544741 RepID=A0A917ZW77_9ACTN|nr:DedA family protein [Wenjunlia tyrosinilytica]GGO95501.1 membrane protein [Wenjunlia tyrosinilytica]